MTRGPPANGELGGVGIPEGKGDCCQVMTVVISQRPGLRTWAKSAMENRQQLRMIESRVVRKVPPRGRADDRGRDHSTTENEMKEREKLDLPWKSMAPVPLHMKLSD